MFNVKQRTLFFGFKWGDNKKALRNAKGFFDTFSLAVLSEQQE
jgi:hypothetical protein